MYSFHFNISFIYGHYKALFTLANVLPGSENLSSSLKTITNVFYKYLFLKRNAQQNTTGLRCHCMNIHTCF